MAESDPFVYNSQLDAFSLYHLVNEANGKSSIGDGPALPALGHALAGSIGSATAKAITYPIDLVVTRLQVQKQLRKKGETESAARDADAEYAGLIDAVTKIYKNEGGLTPFFTGCSSNVGKGIVDSFLFFLAYSWMRNREMRKRDTKTLSVPLDLAIGVAAGCFSKFFTTPIQNVVTRQQTAALRAARDPDSSSPASADSMTISDIVKQIHSERGIAGFWAGYNAAVVLTINPAITFAADNVLRSLLPKSKQQKPGPQLTFLIAALSKAIATSITYPVQLAKSRAQAGGGNESDDTAEDDAQQRAEQDEEPLAGSTPAFMEKSGITPTPERRRKANRQLRKLMSLISGNYRLFVSLRSLYRKEGLAGLYSGLEGDIIKGFLAHGLTMMMKENVHTAVIQLYYVLLKLTRRWPDELKNAQERAERMAGAVSEGMQGAVQGVQNEAGKVLEKGMKGAEKVFEETQKGAEKFFEGTQKGAEKIFEGTQKGAEKVFDETQKGAEKLMDEGRNVTGFKK